MKVSVSHTGIENDDYDQLKRCDLDMTLNSHDYLTKNFVVLVGRLNVSIMGMKRLTIHCEMIIK